MRIRPTVSLRSSNCWRTRHGFSGNVIFFFIDPAALSHLSFKVLMSLRRTESEKVIYSQSFGEFVLSCWCVRTTGVDISVNGIWSCKDALIVSLWIRYPAPPQHLHKSIATMYAVTSRPSSCHLTSPAIHTWPGLFLVGKPLPFACGLLSSTTCISISESSSLPTSSSGSLLPHFHVPFRPNSAAAAPRGPPISGPTMYLQTQHA